MSLTDSSEDCYTDSEYDSHSEIDDVNDEDYTCESIETESDYSETDDSENEAESENESEVDESDRDAPKSSIVRSLIIAAVLAVSVNLVWYINTTHQFSEKLYIEYLKASSNIDF